MRANVGLECKVNVQIQLWEAATGRLLRTVRRHNLVVSAGRNLLRDFLNGDAVSGLTHFAIGTGTTPAAAGDIALQAEILRDVITKKTKDVAKLTVQYYLSSTQANGSALAEAGLFNAAVGGTMYARVTHAVINKTASLAVTYTWDLTFSTP